jgi:hypothetical protein
MYSGTFDKTFPIRSLFDLEQFGGRFAEDMEGISIGIVDTKTFSESISGAAGHFLAPVLTAASIRFRPRLIADSVAFE